MAQDDVGSQVELKPEGGPLELPDPATIPPQAVMKAALQEYADATNRGDAAALVALFAPEATIEDPVGAPLKRPDAFQAWFDATVAYRARITPIGPIRGSWSNEAALVFDVEYDANGRRLRTRTLDVCTFNPEGKITSLRAFWGPEDVEDLGPL